MTKNEAIIDILVNFAYYDNDIHETEIKKIKDIAYELKIDEDIDKKIEFVKRYADTDELTFFAESLAFLNTHLDDKEKTNIFNKIVDVIKADGKIVESERFKAELLSKNWQIDLSKLKI